MTVWNKALLGGLLLLVYYGVNAAYMSPDSYRAFIREDGWIEWLTVVFLASAGVMTCGRLIRIRWRKGRSHFVATTLLAVMCFLAAGEEISWGQRVLDIESPEFFRDNNIQGETNIHNLRLGGVHVSDELLTDYLQCFLFVYLFLLPLLCHRVSAIRRLTTNMAIPLARTPYRYAFVGLTLLISLLPIRPMWELMEFGQSVLLFLILWNPLNSHIYELPAQSQPG